jgi:transcriptional regulator with XRE-family HTH domain
MEDKSRTLREWRELRGTSREELAEQSGVEPAMIARLEEVGDPTVPNTIEGDRFANTVVAALMKALDAHGGIAIGSVPANAMPGHLVLDLMALARLDEDVADFLTRHAEEIHLRMAVPTCWGIGLKNYEDVSEADYQAIVNHNQRQLLHAEAMADRVRGYIALLEEHATDGKLTMGEVFEKRGGRWVPKRGTSAEDK